MGTRAIVAVPHGDSWRGRHTHWDGYPTGRAANLWIIVNRDGLEKARQVITADYYGWSIINATQPDISGIRNRRTKRNYDEPSDSPRNVAFSFSRGQMNGSGQFVNVPGYGVAYSSCVLKDFAGQADYRQSEESQWLGPHEKWNTADTEWAYVLADDGLWVYKCNMTFGKQAPIPPTSVGVYRWDEAEPNWQEVEDLGNLDPDEVSFELAN